MKDRRDLRVGATLAPTIAGLVGPRRGFVRIVMELSSDLGKIATKG